MAESKVAELTAKFEHWLKQRIVSSDGSSVEETLRLLRSKRDEFIALASEKPATAIYYKISQEGPLYAPTIPSPFLPIQTVIQHGV